MPAIYRGIITNLKKEDIVDTISNIVVRNETDIDTDYKYGNVFKGDFDSSHKKQYIEGKTSTSTVATSRTTHTYVYTFEFDGKRDKFRYKTENADIVLENGDELAVNFERQAGGYCDIDFFTNLVRDYSIKPEFRPDLIKFNPLEIVWQSVLVFFASLVVLGLTIRGIGDFLGFTLAGLITAVFVFWRVRSKGGAIKAHNDEQLKEKQRLDDITNKLMQAVE
jgi:hypothetical protein